jgi:hypothetical protein
LKLVVRVDPRLRAARRGASRRARVGGRPAQGQAKASDARLARPTNKRHQERLEEVTLTFGQLIQKVRAKDRPYRSFQNNRKAAGQTSAVFKPKSSRPDASDNGALRRPKVLLASRQLVGRDEHAPRWGR